jgi:hypothetical protein
MIPANINTIGLAEIERLIADRVQESKTIEYKSVLPGGSDGDVGTKGRAVNERMGSVSTEQLRQLGFVCLD